MPSGTHSEVGMLFSWYSTQLALEKSWAQFPVPCTPGMVTHACPHTLEVKVGKQLEVTLHCKFEASLGDIRTCPPNKTKPCHVEMLLRLGRKVESLLNCVTGAEAFTLQ